MDTAETLLAQVREACARLGIAQTTFGRLAVNDGKLVNRLEQGGKVRWETIERVHKFIEERSGQSATTLRAAFGPPVVNAKSSYFRFYGNRHKYLMFVNTSSEKKKIASLALEELAQSSPTPPAIRIFDGGAGDGTTLSYLLRGMHSRFRWLPFYVVAKEISLENVRMTLEKMHDRFQEHPATMLVMTNLRFGDAAWLQPTNDAKPVVWHEVALQGSTSGEFEEQIAGLIPFLVENWQATISERTGHPVYQKPVVLVLYREDHRFLLEPIRPTRGGARADFDMVLLSQPYRATAPLDFKVGKIIGPLSRALAPGGRLVGVQSYGRDPGAEIIQRIWPDEPSFPHDRHSILRSLRKWLGGSAVGYHFHAQSDARAIFRYDFHALPMEMKPGGSDFSMSTLFGAWNAASYVGQIDDRRIATAMLEDRHLDATREVLRAHKGLWFHDEYFVVSRRHGLT